MLVLILVLTLTRQVEQLRVTVMEGLQAQVEAVDALDQTTQKRQATLIRIRTLVLMLVLMLIRIRTLVRMLVLMSIRIRILVLILLCTYLCTYTCTYAYAYAFALILTAIRHGRPRRCSSLSGATPRTRSRSAPLLSISISISIGIGTSISKRVSPSVDGSPLGK